MVGLRSAKARDHRGAMGDSSVRLPTQPLLRSHLARPGSAPHSSIHVSTKGPVYAISLSVLCDLCCLFEFRSRRFTRPGAQGEPRKLTSDVPGPVHQRLDDLAGAWDVAIQYKLGKNVQNGKATCDAKWILGGRFLQQDYHSRFQGEPYHVMQILGYDNQKKKVIELKMDTMSTGVLHNEGEISEDGKVITNMGESLDPRTKKPYKLRTVYTITDRDHFTLEWYRINDGGAGEKVVTLTHAAEESQRLIRITGTPDAFISRPGGSLDGERFDRNRIHARQATQPACELTGRAAGVTRLGAFASCAHAVIGHEGHETFLIIAPDNPRLRR